ncbi:MAG TPA: hypothetical protein VFV19_08830 [Candidatus Polarisedimenticolaceae bacterium]|nr:hypothetical protein [Candidatus Polarisedimenticolaceae bacterium]
MKRFVRAGIGTAIGIAALAGVLALATPPSHARLICECAPLDAPVICKGGKIYANMCVASCFGATGCVPYGGGGVN